MRCVISSRSPVSRFGSASMRIVFMWRMSVCFKRRGSLTIFWGNSRRAVYPNVATIMYFAGFIESYARASRKLVRHLRKTSKLPNHSSPLDTNKRICQVNRWHPAMGECSRQRMVITCCRCGGASGRCLFRNGWVWAFAQSMPAGSCRSRKHSTLSFLVTTGLCRCF